MALGVRSTGSGLEFGIPRELFATSILKTAACDATNDGCATAEPPLRRCIEAAPTLHRSCTGMRAPPPFQSRVSASAVA